MGFTLEEIKYINQDSIKNKISNYEQEILNLQEKIKNLKQFFLPKEGNESKMIFVNDEKAIGKWGLLGVAESKQKALEEDYIFDEYNIKELYLMPNGESYWVISWTKDTIFISGRPNHYEIINDKLYLTISDYLDSKQSKVVVYYNIDHNNYNVENIKQKDNTNIEFFKDEKVVGYVTFR